MAFDPILSFDPIRILHRLTSDGVEFVMIGGMAARLHGSPTVTNDLDICYRKSRENCARLATSLRSLGARLRDVPEDLPIRLDASAIWQGDEFTLVTDAGFLDCFTSLEAGSNRGYDDLRQNAQTVEIGEFSVLLCSLEDLIRMKEAAGRPKDLIEVEVLRAVLAEQRESR